MVRLASLTALVGVALVVLPGATAAGRGPAAESRVISGGAIAAAAHRVGADGVTNAEIADHVAAQARSGRLVDSKAVRAAPVGGGSLTWEAGTVINEARLYRSAAAGSSSRPGDVLELAFLSGEDPASTGPADVGVVGAGLGSASYTGGTRLTSGCQTWTVNGNSVTGCYQKFKPTNDGSSTRDYYAYNRWATAVGKTDFIFDWKPVYVDIRSRPYVGYESRTRGMTDYFPRDSTELCQAGSGIDVGVGSLSLKIGITDCSGKYPIPNATTKTMGLIYDSGFIFPGVRSKGVEFEMEVWNSQGGAVPILGDYNYGKFCYATLLNCSGTLGKNGW